MNWAIKIILKTLMTKISRISWGLRQGGYDKGFYGIYTANYYILNFEVKLVLANYK